MSKIRVVVVDDSAYSRRTISKMLEAMPNVEVVGYASDGDEGLRRIMELKPDLVTLDLVMPKMDGFTMLRILMTTRPTPVIVISSRGEDKRVFKALELGAVDFVAKPTRAISEELLLIRHDLQDKVRSVMSLNMAQVTRRKNEAADSLSLVSPVKQQEGEVASRYVPSRKDVIAIGSSTGGPQAVNKILSMLYPPFPFAVVVSQHMPQGFTHAFAERLNRVSGLDVKEAEDGDVVQRGRAFIAPGGNNLIFQRVRNDVIARVVPPSKEDRYQPSVDVMFQSVADVYGSRALAVVLTGMGSDGSKGVRMVKAAGGEIIAESEETAVVFGMPREAIATGLVDRVAPLDRIPADILSLCALKNDQFPTT